MKLAKRIALVLLRKAQKEKDWVQGANGYLSKTFKGTSVSVSPNSEGYEVMASVNYQIVEKQDGFPDLASAKTYAQQLFDKLTGGTVKEVERKELSLPAGAQNLDKAYIEAYINYGKTAAVCPWEIYDNTRIHIHNTNGDLEAVARALVNHPEWTATAPNAVIRPGTIDPETGEIKGQSQARRALIQASIRLFEKNQVEIEKRILQETPATPLKKTPIRQDRSPFNTYKNWLVRSYQEAIPNYSSPKDRAEATNAMNRIQSTNRIEGLVKVMAENGGWYRADIPYHIKELAGPAGVWLQRQLDNGVFAALPRE